MRRASREINTLSLSALDLFATAMGAFAIITVSYTHLTLPTILRV